MIFKDFIRPQNWLKKAALPVIALVTAVTACTTSPQLQPNQSGESITVVQGSVPKAVMSQVSLVLMSDFTLQAEALGTKAVFEGEIKIDNTSYPLTFQKGNLTTGSARMELSVPLNSVITGTVQVVDESDASVIYRRGSVSLTVTALKMEYQVPMQVVRSVEVVREQSAITSPGIDTTKPVSTSVPEYSGSFVEIPATVPAPTPTPQTGGGGSIPIDEVGALLDVSHSAAGILPQDLADPILLRQKMTTYFANNPEYSGVIPTYENKSGSSKVIAFYKDKGASVVTAEGLSQGSHQLAATNPLLFADMAHNMASSQGCLAGFPLMNWSFISTGTLFEHKLLCLKNDYKPYGTLPYTFALINANEIGGIKATMPELMKALAPLARSRNFLAYIPIGIDTYMGTKYKTIAVMASLRQMQQFNPTYTAASLGQLLLGSQYQSISLNYRELSQGPNTCTTGEHPGIDYPAPVGSDVSAPAAATVAAANAADGTLVLQLSQNPERRMIFLHLDNFNGLAVNDVVQAGDVIGEVGLKGFTTGAHLHVELKKNSNSASCYFTSEANAANHLNPTSFNK